MELKTEKGRLSHICTRAQGVTELPEDTGLLAPWPHSCILCLAIPWALIIEVGGAHRAEHVCTQQGRGWGLGLGGEMCLCVILVVFSCLLSCFQDKFLGLLPQWH